MSGGRRGPTVGNSHNHAHRIRQTQRQQAVQSHTTSPGQPLAILMNRARTRSNAIVARIAEAFRAEIPGYRPGEGLTDEEIRANLAEFLGDVLDRIEGAVERRPADLNASMRRRLEAGISLTSLLHAHRLAAAILWDVLADLAESSAEQKEVLLSVTPRLNVLLNSISLRTQEQFVEIEIRDARRSEQIRATTLNTVLSACAAVGAEFWHAVVTLGIPRIGQFAVLMAVTDEGRLPDDGSIEAMIASNAAVEDVWFGFGANSQSGLVSFRPSKIAALDDIADTVTAHLPVRLGISAPFTSVENCPKAFAQARVASNAATALRPAIRYNRDVLSVLMASSPDAAATVVESTLGPILELPCERRDPLITTMRSWLKHHQSTAATADALNCHRNTVNYRLRRFAELAGGSLADNAWLTQVNLAVNAPAACRFDELR